jgi:hypothetical protein
MLREWRMAAHIRSTQAASCCGISQQRCSNSKRRELAQLFISKVVVTKGNKPWRGTFSGLVEVSLTRAGS